MPLSVLEAQAMECAVITTDARGCREAIAPGETGLLVPSGDPHALAAALLSLHEDAELREKLGKAGRLLAKERFDQQLVFQAFEQAYCSQPAMDQRRIEREST
jgi:glycosyltransferase involved in cell wall biosynthesis